MTTEQILQSNLKFMNEHPNLRITHGDILPDNEVSVSTEENQITYKASGVPALSRASNLFGFNVNR